MLDILAEYERCLIITHDTPDPDAIATGWALAFLIEQKLGKPAELVGGGGIVRAENRHMVDLLGPPIRLVTSVESSPTAATILVDCKAGATNQLMTRQGLEPVAVIDHHPTQGEQVAVRFRDVRPETVASVTIVASYLREQEIEPSPKLATAMWFAMRTETRGEEFHFSPLDRSILTWLTERADPILLAEIESAPLNPEYYSDLVLALQNTFLFNETGLCVLPQAEGAEIVGEMADLLIRCRGIHRVLCAAVVGEDLFVSARTDSDCDDAAELLQTTLDGIGSGGGHMHRAGGKIPCVHRDSSTNEQWQQELRRRWLAACGIEREEGKRLVPKHEIINHLR